MISRYALLIGFLGLAGTLSAQGWERIHSKLAANDYGLQVVATPDGGYAGIRFQGINVTGNPTAFFRTDPDGNILTAVALPVHPDSNEYCNQLLPLPDGNFIISASLEGAANSGHPKCLLYKISPAGAVLWRRVFDNAERGIDCAGAALLPDGRIVAAVTDRMTDTDLAGLAYFDSLGNFLEMKHLVSALPYSTCELVMASGDGDLYAYCRSTFNGKSLMVKLTADGDQIWLRDITQFGNPTQQYVLSSLQMTNTPDHGVAFINFQSPTVNDSFLVQIVTYDSSGNYQWAYPLYTGLVGPFGLYTLTLQDSVLVGVMAAYYQNTPTGNRSDRIYVRLDPVTGAELHRSVHTLTSSQYGLFDAVPTPDGYTIVCGGVEPPGDPAYRPFLWKLDTLGNTFSNKLTGKVTRDLNLDCQTFITELPLKGFTIQAQKDSSELYLTQTNNLGQYTLEVDTGTYSVKVLLPNNYWTPCPDSVVHTFTGFYQTFTANLPLQPEVNCALPDIDVCVPFLRRCFENTYQVRYCNSGTVPLDSADVRIVIDPYMTFVSAQPAPDSIAGDTLWFHFSTALNISDCNQFSFTVLLDCDSTVTGQTHCVEAHIFPDTFCLPPPGWSGASIEVTAECLGDTAVRIVTANRGPVPTTQPVDFIIVEDDVILFQGSQNLNPAEEWAKVYPADGQFWIGEATQEPNHPLMNTPRAFVEGCNGFSSLGYPLLYSQDDSSPFEDIDCRESVASYDPNDKTGLPRGLYAEHFIEQNEDLEYTIRFQNTGTDTAFNVVLRDTLSPWLDWASLRIGAASHPFKSQISGPGVLKFTFANIKLPPDSINEAASQGWVHFRIKQKRDNPLGTQIRNTAAIYFDFNAPVLTNQTLHTVGKNFLTVSTNNGPSGAVAESVRIEPNPVRDQATLLLEGASGENLVFELYDARGALLQRRGFTGSKLSFSRKGLPDGVYFFRVLGPGKEQRSGRVVLVR